MFETNFDILTPKARGYKLDRRNIILQMRYNKNTYSISYENTNLFVYFDFFFWLMHLQQTKHLTF